jgi:hypothetical protein
MNTPEILRMQYDKLFAIYEHHHKRWDDHWKVYLLFLSLVTAILSALFTTDGLTIIKIFLSLIGIVVCLSGGIALNRINNDAKLTLFHMRKFEEDFLEQNVPHYQIFKIGKQFFDTGKYDDLVFKPRFLLKVNILCLALISFGLFATFFIFCIIYWVI